MLRRARNSIAIQILPQTDRPFQPSYPFILVFKDAGIDLSKPVTAMCYSGMSSSALALAADVCGCSDVSVFFVSMDHVGSLNNRSSHPLPNTGSLL